MDIIRKLGLKRLIVYVAVIIWLIAISRYIGVDKTTEVALSAVFNEGIGNLKITNMCAYIEGDGKYGVCFLSDDEKEAMAKDIATELGICEPYEIAMTTDYNGNKVTTLKKTSVNGEVLIKVMTNNKCLPDSSHVSTQYIYMCIRLNKGIDYANDYRDLVTGIFTNMGVESRVNVNLVGCIDGMLNVNEKNQIADLVLNRMDATVFAKDVTGDPYLIYAYAKGIKESVLVAGNRLNLNIAMTYDEVNDKTYVYVSSPMNSLEY